MTDLATLRQRGYVTSPDALEQAKEGIFDPNAVEPSPQVVPGLPLPTLGRSQVTVTRATPPQLPPFQVPGLNSQSVLQTLRPHLGYMMATPQDLARLSAMESGGRYDAIGVVTSDGDRAYGKYQVMGKNIGPWTQAILGQAMTPREFLANPWAQDAVAAAKLGEYKALYGPEGAYRAWFGGPGRATSGGDARDALGTSVDEYGRRAVGASAHGGAPGSALAVPEPSGASSVPSPPTPKYREPLSALGNPVVVLALLGSLFTRQPAVTAMKSLAGAMKAQAAGDDHAYQIQYKQYEETLRQLHAQTEAQNAEYRRYYDNRRLSLSERMARMREAATRYHDPTMNAYVDSGGDPGQILTAREDANKLIGEGLSKTQAVNEMHGKYPDIPKVVLDGLYERAKAAGKGDTKAGLFARAVKEYQDAHPGVSTAEAMKAVGEEAKTETKAAQEAKAANEWLATHPGHTMIEALKAVKEGERAAPQMSGNKLFVEKARDSEIVESLGKIDEALSILNRHVLSAGLAGRALRMKETVGNILGDNETDRVQFRRTIQYLRSAFPHIAFASGGRPLSIDSKRVDEIIGGLEAGDTTANTIRSLEEMRDMYLRQHKTQQELIGVTPTAHPAAPAGSPMEVPAPAKDEGQWWKDSPEVGQ